MNPSQIVSTASLAGRRQVRRLSSLSTKPHRMNGGRVGATATALQNTTATSTPSQPSSSSSTTTTTVASILFTQNTATTSIHRRWFGSGGGARGARGHGWWVNYRDGKGGRHLQGTYHHLDDLETRKAWNDAVFALGSAKAYIDVRVESLAGNDQNSNGSDGGDGGGGGDAAAAADSQQIHRLTLELATEALPLATGNVLKLLDSSSSSSNDDDLGYHRSTLHRIEKGVGILGGLVADNPNGSRKPGAPVTRKKMGRCHPGFSGTSANANAVPIASATTMDISSERLVLHHLGGVFTMLQPRIGEIDSRFLVLSGEEAPHLDGVSVAVGRLADDSSLETVRKWESSLITSHGVPVNVSLRIVGCGILPNDKNNEEQKSVSAESGSTEPEASQQNQQQKL